MIILKTKKPPNVEGFFVFLFYANFGNRSGKIIIIEFLPYQEIIQNTS